MLTTSSTSVKASSLQQPFGAQDSNYAAQNLPFRSGQRQPAIRQPGLIDTALSDDEINLNQGQLAERQAESPLDHDRSDTVRERRLKSQSPTEQPLRIQTRSALHIHPPTATSASSAVSEFRLLGNENGVNLKGSGLLVSSDSVDRFEHKGAQPSSELRTSNTMAGKMSMFPSDNLSTSTTDGQASPASAVFHLRPSPDFYGNSQNTEPISASTPTLLQTSASESCDDAYSFTTKWTADSSSIYNSPAASTYTLPPSDPLARPYWLMRILLNTLTANINSERGSYITKELFVPKDIWNLKQSKIKGEEEKIQACEMLMKGLRRLGSVDKNDLGGLLGVSAARIQPVHPCLRL